MRDERGAVLLDLLAALVGGLLAGSVTTVAFTQGGAIAGGITVGEGLVFAITSVGVTATIFLWKRQDAMQKDWNARHDATQSQWNARHDAMQIQWHTAQVEMEGSISGLIRGEAETQRRLERFDTDFNSMGSKIVNQIFARYDHRFEAVEGRQTAFDERVRDLEARRSKGGE